MPIPQPTVRGPGQYEALQGNVQAVQQGLNTVAQAGMFNRNLREEQRQFDTTNRLNYYNDVVQNQYGGNWAAFIRGPQTGENSYAGNDVARQMFNDLYGENADQLYNEALRATPETIQQMSQSILNEAYLKGTGKGREQQSQGQQQPQTIPNQIASPVAPQNTEPAGSFQATAIPQPGQTIVPGSSEGGTVDAVSGAGYASPQGAGGGGETLAQIYGEFLNMDPGEVQNMLDAPNGQASIPLVTGIANLDDAQQKAFNDRVRKMRAGGSSSGAQDVQPSPAQYNVNTPAKMETTTTRNNIPMAPDQENAVFPLNSATFNGMDIRVERPESGSYDKAIANGLADWARQTVLSTTGDAQRAQEAAAFVGRATRGERAPQTPEEWAEYDRKTREYFGVSKDEFITMRNIVFENNKTGKPPGTIPENIEEKEWMWGGIPDPDKATTVTTTLDDVDAASDEDRNATVNTLADDPKAAARVNTVEPEKIDKLLKWYADQGMTEDAAINQASKAFGLPVSAIRDLATPGKDPATYTNRERAAFGRMTRKGEGIARRSLSNPKGGTLAEALRTTDDRRQEIYDEIKLYTQGHPEMLSPEVLASMPDSLVESRRFESQLGLEERRMTLEEQKGEAYIDSLAADTAYKNAMLGLQKAKQEADAAVSSDPELQALTMAIEMSEPVYKNYLDNIMKNIKDRGGSFDAEKFVAAVAELRNSDAAFRDAEKLHVEMLGILTGTPTSEAEVARKRGLAAWLFGQQNSDDIAQPQLFSTPAPGAVAPANTGGTPAADTGVSSGTAYARDNS